MYKFLIVSHLDRVDVLDSALIQELSAHCKVTVLDKALLSSLTDIRYHYILILKPATIPALLDNEYLKAIMSASRAWPKIIVKSRSAIWFNKPEIKDVISEHYHISSVDWVKQCIDKIVCQNDLYLKQIKGVLPSSLVITNGLAVPIKDYDVSINPYDPNKSYINTNAVCPNVIDKTNKRIVIYIGSAKADNGKVLQTMAEIMKALGCKYELHLFLTSFLLPHSRKKCDGSDISSLIRLRDTVFNDCNNVIIHYKYEYENRHPYIYYADCAIDFATSRNSKKVDRSEHLRLVEYCELGVPVVYESKIPNAHIAEINGIEVPFNATVTDYANAIKKACDMVVDRQACKQQVLDKYCMTKRAKELFDALTK